MSRSFLLYFALVYAYNKPFYQCIMLKKYTKWRLNFSVLSDFSYLLPLISRSFPSPCPEFLLLLRGIDVQTMFTSLIGKSSPKCPLRSKLLSLSDLAFHTQTNQTARQPLGALLSFYSKILNLFVAQRNKLGCNISIRIDHTILWYFFLSIQSLKK